MPASTIAKASRTGSSITFGYNSVDSSMYESESKTHFGNINSARTDPTLLSQSRKDREAIKKDLMATHYDIGSNTYTVQYETSNKMNDFTKGKVEKAALNKNQMDDLRAVHYRLGNNSLNYTTTSHDSYVPPVGATRASLSEEVRKDLRAHHFDVNTGDKSVASSTYDATYKFHPDALHVSPEELEKKKKLRKDLSACHYKLGNNYTSYSTTGEQPDPRDFPGFVGKGQRADIDVKSTNWTMGSDHVDYKTTYTNFNDGKERGKDLLGTLDVWEDRRLNPKPELGGPELALIQQRKNLIKKSSVYMGSEESMGNIKSESKEMQASILGVVDSASNNKRVRDMRNRIGENNKTHYVLGSDPLDYQKTMITLDPRDTNMKPAKLSLEVKEQLKNTHFHLGFDPNEYSTTTTSDFVQKEAVSASLNKALKADLRASHFTVGSDSVIRMNSVYSVSHNLDSNYKNPALEPEAKAKMAALKSELKDTHYILGMGSDKEYNRSSKMPLHAEYKKPKVKSIDLRTTNWTMGDTKVDYSTEQSRNYHAY